MRYRPELFEESSVAFFFSSRGRHTRFDCDWSSDVCSSDLEGGRIETDHCRPGGQVWTAEYLGAIDVNDAAVIADHIDSEAREGAGIVNIENSSEIISYLIAVRD